MRRIIVHVDMDAFYAAIEQRDQPELRGRPVVVGGKPDSRGVVSSASYEARAFGVRSAMPSAEARRLCPEALFLPVDMPRYADASGRLMRLLETFTPTIEPLSIDEAFLDMTGTERLFGGPVDVGHRVKAAIREALDLTASVGVAPNKLIAKLASGAHKPDGLVVVGEGDVAAFLADMPVGRLWGVGEGTERKLQRLGIRTIGELARYPRDVLAAHLDQMGQQLHDLANGIDERAVETEREAKSVSSEITFEEDVSDQGRLEGVLFELAEQVAWRLRKKRLRGRTITLKLRYSDFRTITRSRSRRPTNHGPEVFSVARELLRAVQLGGRRVRLLGVAASQLCGEGDEVQLSLFDDHEMERARAVDDVLDALTERFGRDSIGRGRSLGPRRERSVRGWHNQ